jgi:hypothetical protein
VRDAKEELRAALHVSVPARSGDFAQAMMDLGATICAPRTAVCMLCPIQPGCIAIKLGDPTIYPVKPAKAERPVRKGHAYVMTDAEGDVFLQSRPEKGLLGGMTEVPGSDWAAALPAANYPVEGNWRHRGQVLHIFTHFRLELEVWSAQVVADGLDGGWWAEPLAVKGEALPTLFIEFHGSPAAVREQVATMQSLAEDSGGSGFAWAERPEDRTRLWKARHECYHANMALQPGAALIGTDACVPISNFVACVLETRDDVRASGLTAPLVGHAGDGNFHLGIVFDPPAPMSARAPMVWPSGCRCEPFGMAAHAPASTVLACTAFTSSRPNTPKAWR